LLIHAGLRPASILNHKSIPRGIPSDSLSVDNALAVRFHHRLVFVHPFPNGNGRWSRLASDLLIVQNAGERFTWGRANLQTATDVRRAYIKALQAADRNDIEPLVAFSRS